MIENLKEALEFSPDNIPLRLHLADALYEAARYDEAETHYQYVLRLQAGNNRAKFGLAKVYYAQASYSTSGVILEELLGNEPHHFDYLLLYIRTLVKENEIQQAIDKYELLLNLRPDFTDEELDSSLRVQHQLMGQDDSHHEDENYFIQKPDTNFSHVGGMESVKKEIELKIIQPLKNPEIYKAYGKKIGGGILLYGPPGCGKTFMAKATAGEIDAKFISVGLNDILDMWIGNSEKNLHGIFEMARRNTPCVLFFDEIDALGANRNDMKQSSSRQLINQFLQELDGVEHDNEGILIIGATNTPWHLDPAFRRPGRFDRIIFNPLPDEEARKTIFQLKLKEKPTDQIDYAALAKKAKNFSGADIEAVIDMAIEDKLEEALKDGIPKPLTNKELLKAIKRHNASTGEWFNTAKNYALYSNESGIYDDILEYMNRKK